MPLGAAFRPPTVGLDIGSSAVKAVVLKRGRGGWSLVAAGEAPMPEGSLQDGTAANRPRSAKRSADCSIPQDAPGAASRRRSRDTPSSSSGCRCRR
jgi:hypothetical protein